jgi:hypothetical protein
MSSLAAASRILDAPRRAHAELQRRIDERLEALGRAEAAVHAVERQCAVREAVFHRALDAGRASPSEAALRRWVEHDLLPSLPPPASVVRLLKEFEERALSLDETLLRQEARELELAEAAHELGLVRAELALREDEIERRMRVSSLDTHSAEQGVKQQRAALRREAQDASARALSLVVLEESVARAQVEADGRGERTAIELRLAGWLAAFADQRTTAMAARATAQRIREQASGRHDVRSTLRRTLSFPTATQTDPSFDDLGPTPNVSVRAHWNDNEGFMPLTPSRSEPLRAVVSLSVVGDACDPEAEDALAVRWREVEVAEAQVARREADADAREARLAALFEYVLAQRAACDSLSAQLIAATNEVRQTRADHSSRQRRGRGAERPMRTAPSPPREETADEYAVHPLLAFARTGRMIES